MAGTTVQTVECERHRGQVASLRCSQCGNLICRMCVQEFGYYCSAECLEESRAEVSTEEREAREFEEVELQQATRRTAKLVWLVTAVLAALATWAVWRATVAAPGKPAWVWQPPSAAGQVELIACTDQEVLALAGGKVYQLDSRRGRVRAMVALPIPVGDSLVALEALEAGYLGVSPTACVRFDLKTGEATGFSFEQPSSTVALGPGGDLLGRLLPRQYDYGTGRVEQPSRLQVVGVGDGAQRWSREAEGERRFVRLLAVGQWLAVVEETAAGVDGQAGGPSRLAVHDFADGRLVWRLNFEQPLVWGPVVGGDYLALQAGNTFLVVDREGVQRWALAVPDNDYPAHVVTGTHAYVQQESGQQCFDLADGRKLWTCESFFDGGLFAEAGRRLLASGFTGRGQSAVSPLLPGAGQMQSVLEEMQAGSGGALRGLLSRPVVMLLDAASGQPYWTRENVSGDLFGDGARLVEVSGAGSVNLLQLLSKGGGGRGATVRQFKIRNGDLLYIRRLKFSFDPYALSGRRLVGVAYGMTADNPGPVVMGLRLK